MTSNQEVASKIWATLKTVRNYVRAQPRLKRSDRMLQKILDGLMKPSDKEGVAYLEFDLAMHIPPRYRACRDLKANVYENETSVLFKKLVRRGMRVVDLGANIGYYSLLASRLVGKNGHVYAFEPVTQNLDYLKKNVELNNCLNVIIVPMAVGEITREMLFQQYSDHTLGHLIPNADENNSLLVKVQAVRLDDFMADQNWPRIDFVKADVEGGEVAALKGMTETCKRNSHLHMLLEYNPKALERAHYTGKDFVTTVSKLGFSTVQIPEQNMKQIPVDSLLEYQYGAFNILLSK